MNILIIGGVAAGMSVAAKARRENPESTISVIEQEDYISFGACGLPYYLGDQFQDPNIMFARTPAQMEKAKISLYLKHRALSVDFTLKKVSAKNLNTNDIVEFTYDRLMIATGASPRIPPLDGITAKNVYTLTQLHETDTLKKNLDHYDTIGIIGGGFIGVEVAEQLQQQGKKVIIFHANDALMNKPFDPEFSAKILNALTEKGVKVILNQKVNGFVLNDEQSVSALTMEDQSVTVDAVVIAIGFQPNTQFLNDPRLKKLENGAIVINKYGETSIPNVFSGGDCATVPHRLLGDIYLPLATSANKLGRIIGTNIITSSAHYEHYVGSLGSSAIKVCDYEAGTTGITETQAKSLDINYKTTLVHTQNHTGYWPNPTSLTIKLVYEKDSLVLLGAQIFGKKDAVLRLTGLTTAIHAGLTTDEIGLIDYAYSPPFALTWEAINIAANTAK